MNNKIFIIVPSLAIGGQEKIAIETAELLKEKYDVLIIVFHRHENEYDTNCNIINLNSSSNNNNIFRFFSQIGRIYKLIKLKIEYKPLVLYSFGTTANITNALSSFIHIGKTIIAIHGFASVKKNIVNKITYLLADKIICISKAMQYKLLKLYPRINKTVVIENGYDINKIVIKSQENCVRLNQGINFIAVGRLEKVKAFDRLIKAFALTTDVLNNVNLYIVGKGSQENKLKEIVKKLNLENKVFFTGYQKNPYSFMATADVFVLSSNSEGFPNVMIEALACKLAIVSIDCQSGPREILEEEYYPEDVVEVKLAKYGILTECSTEDKKIKFLSEGMIRIASDTSLREKYKNESINRALCYTNTIYIKKIEKIIK